MFHIRWQPGQTDDEREQGGIFAPILICDHCKREITDIHAANYLFDLRAPPPLGTPLFIAHMECSLSCENQRFPDCNGGMENLVGLLYYLRNRYLPEMRPHPDHYPPKAVPKARKKPLKKPKKPKPKKEG